MSSITHLFKITAVIHLQYMQNNGCKFDNDNISKEKVCKTKPMNRDKQIGNLVSLKLFISYWPPNNGNPGTWRNDKLWTNCLDYIANCSLQYDESCYIGPILDARLKEKILKH